MVLKNVSIFAFVLCICFVQSYAASLLDWFNWEKYISPFSFSENSGQGPVINKEQVNLREGVTLIPVPFEELSPEEKFLQEAERINSVSLSGIDSCEHRVVMKIQTSCADINEEELAKLSIRLLNCQSEVSGRSQVICTDEMSLKECTSPMDSETWNAYHIINNRARAVCYATRQQQFRALSEMTVNKLMTSALKQLTTMDNLEELQKELNALTSDTVTSLKEGQQGLIDQNSGLRLAQRRVQDSITTNLKHLSQEKLVIQNMQNQLKTLSEKLSRDLGDVESRLESHSEQHQTIHQEIVSSLAAITLNTNALWNTIDEKSRQLQQQQDAIKKSSIETLENLKQINVSVSYLLGLVAQVKSEVDSKLTLVTDTIGGDGATVLTVLLHTLYLLGAVLVSLFLQLTLACRLLLLVAVLSNIALVYHHRALSFLTLSALIVGLWVLTALVPVGWSLLKKRKSGSNRKHEDTKKEEEDDDEEDRISTKSSRSGSVPFMNNATNYNGPSFSDITEEPVRDTDSLSGLRYRRSGSTQLMCAAVCRNGQLCRSTPTPGNKFCRRHITH